MKKDSLIVLLVAGVFILLWGMIDFYHLLTIWSDLFAHYAGTDMEEPLAALGKANFETAVVKTAIGLAAAGISAWKLKKA